MGLRYNDFFRGRPRSALLPSFAVINDELIQAPRSFSLSLWETLVVRDLRLAAFYDLYWPEAAALGGKAEPSLGLSLTGETALMGLLPLNVMLSGGYDLGAQGAFFTLNLGVPY